MKYFFLSAVRGGACPGHLFRCLSDAVSYGPWRWWDAAARGVAALRVLASTLIIGIPVRGDPGGFAMKRKLPGNRVWHVCCWGLGFLR